MTVTKTEDGSFVDENGRVLFFGFERFVRDIVNGACCFICGAKPGSKPFNDEHVIPQWVLTKCGIGGQRITLPNDATIMYDQYRVPCCADCNALMGDQIESRVSKLFNLGHDALCDHLVREGTLEPFVWMALIFLKTHLKDREFRFELDRRKPSGTIAEEFDWAEFHHVHTVARCFYSGCRLDPGVTGSLLILPFHAANDSGVFDYGDLHFFQTAMIRLGDTALIAVFNDAMGASNLFNETLARIEGPVSEVQVREIMVRLAFLNFRIKERPVFWFEVNGETNEYRLRAKHPDVVEMTEPDEWAPKLYGRMLHDALGRRFPEMRTPSLTANELKEFMKAGKATFLFDDAGRFIKN
jgi:hypothetical protein